jgi:type II secretory ATPase GspE/PulE/Tfp pilus assembly ATPase PilB-like protein
MLPLADLQVATGLSISCMVAPRRTIEQGLGEAYGPMPLEAGVEPYADLRKYVAAHPEIASTAEGGPANSPVGNLVDLILSTALDDAATAIGLEARTDRVEVRFERDGVWRLAMTPPVKSWSAIRTRLSTIAGSPSISTGAASEGRLRIHGRGRGPVEALMRVLPTVAGGRIVLRLPDRRPLDATLPGLGFASEQVALLETTLRRGCGLILIVGRPRSGLTTTQYTLALSLARADRQVATIENNVALALPGVTQVPCGPGTPLSRAEAISRCLAEPPDVLVVDDVSEPAVGRLAMEAVDDGLLVVAGLAARSGAVALERLLELGLPPTQLCRSLQLVVHQVASRPLCPGCRKTIASGPEALERLGLTPADLGRLGLADPGRELVLNGPGGCDRCDRTGYVGRQVLFELISPTEGLRHALVERTPYAKLRQDVEDGAIVSLKDSITRGVLVGAIGLAEHERLLASC